MGRTDSHLHRFKIGVVCFSYPYELGDLEEMTAIDSRFVNLIHIVPHIRPFQGTFHFGFDYEYDFGDSWEHEVWFEDVLPPDAKQKAPTCTGGERACPPEDMGGVEGYQYCREAIKDPEHPEHERYQQWNRRDFDPAGFDLDAMNKALRALK